MTGITEWLAAIGQAGYAERFLDARIDLDVLPDLAEEDLERLGVALGDRKRIMRGIAALGPRDAEPPAPAWQPGERARTGRPDPGRRRQITLCFVDLVGSTALSEKLDLEDYRNLIQRYHAFCTDVVRRHGGYVAHFAGDGALAYFGYPRAGEDDARRAVLAAFDIVTRVPSLSDDPAAPLSARAGVATGDVVVEGVGLTGAPLSNSAMGDVPNLAARLQAVARPGEVAISATTRALLGSEFVCEDAGRQALKGFEEPVQVYRVGAVEAGALRFEARQKGRRAPLVGREEELALLLRRWERAADGRGNVVLIGGEAGIGKSRLARELAENLGEQALCLEFQCSPHHAGSALYPVIGHLEHAARIRLDDPPEVRREKLMTAIETLMPVSTADRDIFLRLMSLAGDGEGADGDPGADARLLKDATMEALVRRVCELADHEAPVLMLMEDLHWCDPTTLDLIDLLIEQIAARRVLLVCTFRREFSPPWIGQPRVTKIELRRLEPGEAAAVVRHIAEGTGDVAVEAIVEKTDGIPLFIEEMTKTVLDVGARDVAAARNGEGLALPSTLKDSLMARIDRLPHAEQVLAVGAAIGRSFAYPVLAAVIEMEERTLRRALDALVEAELLLRRGTPPDATYTFKHALVQDVAYKTMLKSHMRELHGRIGHVIERRFPQVGRDRPEVVAYHHSRAGDHDAALAWWERAAREALRRSANAEAIAHLGEALAQNERAPDPERRVETEIRLREMLCVPLEARSWGSEEIAENLARLHALVGDGGDPAQLFTILHGLCGVHMIEGTVEEAHDYAARMREVARRARSDTFAVLAEHALGMASFFLGRFREAIDHFESAIARRESVTETRLQKYYVADPRVVGRAMQAWALALAADAEAERAITRALAEVRAAEHDFTRTYGLAILACAHQSRGDAENVGALAGEALALSREHGFTYWEAWAEIVRGWARAMAREAGEAPEGIGELLRGIERYRATGSRQILGYARALLAEACLGHGRLHEAEAALEEIDELAREQTIRFYDGPLAALRARIAEVAERPPALRH